MSSGPLEMEWAMSSLGGPTLWIPAYDDVKYYQPWYCRYPVHALPLSGFFLEYNFRGGKSTFLEIEGGIRGFFRAF